MKFSHCWSSLSGLREAEESIPKLNQTTDDHTVFSRRSSPQLTMRARNPNFGHCTSKMDLKLITLQLYSIKGCQLEIPRFFLASD